MTSHLYSLDGNLYKYKEPVFEIVSLKDSNICNVRIFAGNSITGKREKGAFRPKNFPSPSYLYFESSEEITARNYGRKLKTFFDLLGLIFDVEIYKPRKVEINTNDSFENIYNIHGLLVAPYDTETFYNGQIGEAPPGIGKSFEDFNVYARSFNGLCSDKREWLRGALFAYTKGVELGNRENPHEWYSIQMTIFLQVIDALAPNQEKVCDYHADKCPTCFKDVNWSHLTTVGYGQEKIMSEVDPSGKMTKFIKEMYKKRSKFVHQLELSGNELDGGYFSDWGSISSISLLTNLKDVQYLVRNLLLRFILDPKNQITINSNPE